MSAEGCRDSRWQDEGPCGHRGLLEPLSCRLPTCPRLDKSLFESVLHTDPSGAMPPPVGGSWLQMAGRRGCWPHAHPCLCLSHKHPHLVEAEVKQMCSARRQLGADSQAAPVPSTKAPSDQGWVLRANLATMAGPLPAFPLSGLNRYRWSPYPPRISSMNASGFVAVLWAFSVFIRRQLGRAGSSQKHWVSVLLSPQPHCVTQGSPPSLRARGPLPADETPQMATRST